MIKSPEKLIYDNEGKPKEDHDIYSAFPAVTETPQELYPSQYPQNYLLSMGQMSSLVLWVYPDGYITSKRYSTDVGMIHVKGK